MYLVIVSMFCCFGVGYVVILIFWYSANFFACKNFCTPNRFWFTPQNLTNLSSIFTLHHYHIQIFVHDKKITALYFDFLYPKKVRYRMSPFRLLLLSNFHLWKYYPYFTIISIFGRNWKGICDTSIPNQKILQRQYKTTLK